MATLKQSAQEFHPKQTKNIAELSEVSTDLEVYEGNGVNKDNEEFSYKFIEVNGEEYRVPEVVLRDLKTMLEENQALNKFKVKKSGQGLSTRYTVIPIN